MSQWGAPRTFRLGEVVLEACPMVEGQSFEAVGPNSKIIHTMVTTVDPRMPPPATLALLNEELNSFIGKPYSAWLGEPAKA